MKPNNTSVLLIYTGGTIGMFENPETGALENFDFEQLQKQVHRIIATEQITIQEKSKQN